MELPHVYGRLPEFSQICIKCLSAPIKIPKTYWFQKGIKEKKKGPSCECKKKSRGLFARTSLTSCSTLLARQATMLPTPTTPCSPPLASPLPHASPWGDKSRLDATLCSPSSPPAHSLPCSLSFSPGHRTLAEAAVAHHRRWRVPRPNPRPPEGSPRRPLQPRPRNHEGAPGIAAVIRIPFSPVAANVEQAHGGHRPPLSAILVPLCSPCRALSHGQTRFLSRSPEPPRRRHRLPCRAVFVAVPRGRRSPALYPFASSHGPLADPLSSLLERI